MTFSFARTVRWVVLSLLVLLVGCGDKPTKDGGAPVPAKDGKPVTPQPPVAPAKDSGPAVAPAAKDETSKDGKAETNPASKDGGKETVKAEVKDDAISLFDGKTLGKWKATNFGGEGEVEVKDGALIINTGSPLSGVTWQGEPPVKMNYEITLEAQRVEGSDFFLALTVPVKEEHISLILGGWGGTLVGLSSIDGADASENEYTQYQNFKEGQWYKVKMVVKEKQIIVSIDGKQVIDANIEDRKVGTRIEVEISKPLGIATFATKGAYRNIQVKSLK